MEQATTKKKTTTTLRLADSARVHATFDFLCDLIKDESRRAEVNVVAASNLNDFLRFKMDINKIIELLDAETIFRNYDKLVEHGAKISFEKMVKGMRRAYIYDNLEKLVKIGVNADDIIHWMFDDDWYVEYHGDFTDASVMAKRFLDLGATAKLVFEMTRGYIQYGCSPVEVANEISNLDDHGLDRITSRNFIVDYAIEKGYCGAIINYWYPPLCELTTKLGLDQTYLVEGYLDEMTSSGDTYAEVMMEDLSLVPSIVSMNQLIEHVSMEDIIAAHLYTDGLDIFIDEFVARGGDIDTLTDKMLDEISVGRGASDEDELNDLYRIFRDALLKHEPTSEYLPILEEKLR